MSCHGLSGNISVVSALFGRRVEEYYCFCLLCLLCNTDCDTSGDADLAVVNSICDGKENCEVPVTCCGSNDIFTDDPCWGTKKYLRVTYRCISVITVPLDSPDFTMGK